MTHTSRSLALAAVLWGALAAVPHVAAQGTRSDYERAANLRRLTENKVFRDRVRPHWLPGGTRFWYRVRTGVDTHEFVLVDAESAARGPAFDHARMAEALNNAGLEEARAESLPIDRLEWDPAGQGLVFRSGDSTCQPEGSANASDPEPASPSELAQRRGSLSRSAPGLNSFS